MAARRGLPQDLPAERSLPVPVLDQQAHDEEA